MLQAPGRLGSPGARRGRPAGVILINIIVIIIRVIIIIIIRIIAIMIIIIIMIIMIITCLGIQIERP